MMPLISMLRRRLMNAVLWQVLFIGAAITIPVTNYLTVQAMMGRGRVVIMDQEGTLYLTRSGGFEEESALRQDMAKLAAETIFDRSPDGYDNPKRIERLFNTQSAEQLFKDAQADAEVFTSQTIHQKVETGEIKEIPVDNDTSLVSVKCQILRNGSIVRNDARNATLYLRMTLNHSFKFGKYPVVVTKYESKF